MFLTSSLFFYLFPANPKIFFQKDFFCEVPLVRVSSQGVRFNSTWEESRRAFLRRNKPFYLNLKNKKFIFFFKDTIIIENVKNSEIL